MAGKRLDELADGRLDKVLNEGFSDLRAEICFGRSARCHPLSAERLEFLMAEVDRAIAGTIAWLTQSLKNNND